MELYLFSVQCTTISSDQWSKKPILFFVDLSGRRYTFILSDYVPYILLKPRNDDLESTDIETYLDEHCSHVSITMVDECEKTPLVGFTNNRKDKLFRVHFRDIGSKYRIMKQLEGLDVSVVHRGFSNEMLLFHITGLKLQQWYKFDGRYSVMSFMESGISGSISLESLTKLVEAPVPIPPLSFAHIRLTVRSSTATSSNAFIPDHTIQNDVIQSCEFRLGSIDHDTVSRTLFVDQDEKQLIRRIVSWFKDKSPCILVHMSDPIDSISYLHFRSQMHGISSGLSAICGAPCIENTNMSDNSFRDLVCPGRESVDILHILQKFMTSPPLDGFSLADAFTHPKLIRNKDTIDYNGDEDLTLSSLEARYTYTSRELDIMCALQSDNAFILNSLALSASCDLPLFNIVSRGQQARAFSFFAHAYHDDDIYINHDQFDTPYVIVKRNRDDSSFPDPKWVNNPPLKSLRMNDESHTVYQRKRKRSVLDILGKNKRTVQKRTEKRYGGGFVIQPDPGFYNQPWQAVCTMDFASLYPSIMEGYRTCYMRVCYDERWLDDVRAEKEYIPLDDDNCCVFIRSYDGIPVRSITDTIVGEVVKNRKRVRAKMKETTDKFSLQSLNGTQLSMKVLQNAFYGACGSQTFGIPCTAIAASVCTIGQWMNKSIRHRAMLRGCRCVYGDTDSVFIQFPTRVSLVTRDDILRDIYRQAKELETETTRMFPPPNAVEFETLKLPHLQTNKKKLYAAKEYPPLENGWNSNPSELFKGFCFKKRDRCTFVYEICKSFMDCLFSNDMTDDNIVKWYKEIVHVRFFVKPDETQLPNFIITCRLNEVYKNENVLALNLADVYEKETGCRPRPGRRLKFLVAEFTDGRKHFQSAVTPSMFLKHGHRLDVSYYLEKQLLLPIKQVLDLKPLLYERLRRVTGNIITRLSSRSNVVYSK